MELGDRLRTWAETMDPEGAVTVSVRWLRDELGLSVRDPGVAPEPIGDMTAQEVAAEVGRAVSTVRGWCCSGMIENAYKLNGREWRVSRAALLRFRDSQREAGRLPSSSALGRNHRPDLGAWRGVHREHGKEKGDRIDYSSD